MPLVYTMGPGNISSQESCSLLKNLKFFDLLELERAYASANPYGTVHESHRDYDINSNGGITVMYYLNNSWDLSLGGETVFYDINKYEIFLRNFARIFYPRVNHCHE